MREDGGKDGEVCQYSESIVSSINQQPLVRHSNVAGKVLAQHVLFSGQHVGLHLTRPLWFVESVRIYPSSFSPPHTLSTDTRLVGYH